MSGNTSTADVSEPPRPGTPSKGRDRETDDSNSYDPVIEKDGIIRAKEHQHAPLHASDMCETMAGVIGNVLEWYDFAVFGYFSDVIGEVFFPPNQSADTSTTESFVVFGGAFLMRPIGGLLLGYLGDTYGRRYSLVLSIFLMAVPTFAMGLLPSYASIGPMAIVLLVFVRLLQGLSVGGQLMSSLVFTLEGHDDRQWGLYGSFVMAAANLGTLLGGIVAFGLRVALTPEQLKAWGWRIPFLSGIVVSISGFYLRSHGDHDYHVAGENGQAKQNPLKEAFALRNLRSLLASTMVPMLWSAGFYLTFVWMAVFMSDLIENKISAGFGINSLALLLSVCLLFPIAGILSDRFGRVRVMVVGGTSLGLLSPLFVFLISKGNPYLAFFCQFLMGIALSLWGAPMCAWLVESFEPSARLTSIAVGYNLAHAIAGGSAPALATILADHVAPWTPGLVISFLAAVSVAGLLIVAPSKPPHCVDAIELVQHQDDRKVNTHDDDDDDGLL